MHNLRENGSRKHVHPLQEENWKNHQHLTLIYPQKKNKKTEGKIGDVEPTRKCEDPRDRDRGNRTSRGATEIDRSRTPRVVASDRSKRRSEHVIWRGECVEPY